METIGKYKILEVLGEGGMGVVYKAFDPLMEREVAIKVLLESAFKIPEYKERFYREARSAGKLSHHNITIVHDLGEIDGKPYIVMEYLAGTDLRAIIKSKKPVSLLDKIDYAIQICQGLAYSHSRNIIHRDIKPENIRILTDGKVKIMDFGIAKPLSSKMTQTGMVMGTPHYMSPEQIQCEKVEKASDVFSFGVLFYELLTSRLPFPGDSPTTVTHKIVHEKPQPLGDLEIKNQSLIANIIQKCLQKNPSKRYLGFLDISKDLEKVKQVLYTVEKKRIDQIQTRQWKSIQKQLKSARKAVKKQQYQQAETLLTSILQMDPQNATALELMAGVNESLQTAAEKQQIAELLHACKMDIDNRKFPHAQKKITRILAQQPNHSEALSLKQRIAELTASDQRETRILHADDDQTILIPDKVPEIESGTMVEKPMRRKRPLKALLAATGLLSLALLILYRVFFYAPAPSYGFVELNILPWAEIAKIVGTDESAQTVTLSDQLPRLTPCRFKLPAGDYTVFLSNPAFEETLRVSVSIKADQIEKVQQKLPGFDYQTLVGRL
ncbi:MAG: protein kinase [bacterium]